MWVILLHAGGSRGAANSGGSSAHPLVKLGYVAGMSRRRAGMCRARAGGRRSNHANTETSPSDRPQFVSNLRMLKGMARNEF